jgi:hypothetical protein
MSDRFTLHPLPSEQTMNGAGFSVKDLYRARFGAAGPESVAPPVRQACRYTDQRTIGEIFG